MMEERRRERDAKMQKLEKKKRIRERKKQEELQQKIDVVRGNVGLQGNKLVGKRSERDSRKKTSKESLEEKKRIQRFDWQKKRESAEARQVLELEQWCYFAQFLVTSFFFPVIGAVICSIGKRKCDSSRARETETRPLEIAQETNIS